MDLFDIIGPVMIGPSSSHTAGAARIGYVARELLGGDVARAEISLHGSFAATYTGHGTDRALVAGLMGMRVDDARLRDSLDIARRAGLDYSFKKVEIPDAHPNTAVLDLTSRTGDRVCVRASSVGGGAIRVDMIDGMAVSFRVDSDTIVVRHVDMPGVIAAVSSLIAQGGVNIATMQVFRACEGGEAIMAIEVDAPVTEELRTGLSALENVSEVCCIRKF